MEKKLTGDNYPHTKMMTLKEWKEFVNNFNPTEPWHEFIGQNPTEIKEYLIKFNDLSFYLLIRDAFGWANSTQGFDYWYEISERTKPVS